MSTKSVQVQVQEETVVDSIPLQERRIFAPQGLLAIDEEGVRRNHNPAFTESIPIRKQNLNVWDVASLILNKMVGTGIFTTPGSILQMTKSKGFTIGLWAFGGPYCLLCLLVYLDYGTGFPFNGGELIYVNAVWPCPDMLQAFLFAAFFISLGHTAGNSVAFSRHVLLAADDTTHPSTLHSGLVKGVAIVILGIVCVLLWITPKTGLFLNKLLALYKVVLLLVLSIAGFVSGQSSESATADWGPPDKSINAISGLIYIIYSYTGWENANYIIGDISTKRKDLRNGAFGAVFLVTVLYTMMSAAFLTVCNTDDLNDADSAHPAMQKRDADSYSPPPADLGIAWVFAERVFRHRHGVEVCIAISAFGNLIAVAYTSSKVKQAIALHHFLPASGFFARDDHFMTPGGALLLHFSCSSIVILAMPNSTDGYNFVISLFTYGQLLVGIAVGLGLPRLRDAVKRSKLESVTWKPFFRNQALTWVFGPLLACVNLVVMIGAAAHTVPGDTNPNYLVPVVLFSILTFGLFYWWCFRRLKGSVGHWLGWNVSLETVEGLDELDQMQREERRDGTEQYFKHHLTEAGVAQHIQRRSRAIASWIEREL